MFKFSIFPREKKFLILFEQSAQNAVKIAKQLKDMVNIWENIKERVEIITDLEHQGDAIIHQIMAQLNKTFITPFDREDITLLAHSLDDITDFIHSAADDLLLYKIEFPTQRAKELSDIIVQIAIEVEKAVTGIHDRIDKKQLLDQCMEINRLENMGDGIYRLAMAELFYDCSNIAYVIKWSEIYKHMETAIDRCEDVADVLEGVALKYA